MPMTPPESPLASRAYASPPAGGGPIGRRTRILAAVLGSPLAVAGVAGGIMALWALAEGRWNDATEHAAAVPALVCGLLLLASARSGRDVVRDGLHAVLRGARRAG